MLQPRHDNANQAWLERVMTKATPATFVFPPSLTALAFTFNSVPGGKMPPDGMINQVTHQLLASIAALPKLSRLLLNLHWTGTLDLSALQSAHDRGSLKHLSLDFNFSEPLSAKQISALRSLTQLESMVLLVDSYDDPNHQRRLLAVPHAPFAWQRILRLRDLNAAECMELIPPLTELRELELYRIAEGLPALHSLAHLTRLSVITQYNATFKQAEAAALTVGLAGCVHLMALKIDEAHICSVQLAEIVAPMTNLRELSLCFLPRLESYEWATAGPLTQSLRSLSFMSMSRQVPAGGFQQLRALRALRRLEFAERGGCGSGWSGVQFAAAMHSLLRSALAVLLVMLSSSAALAAVSSDPFTPASSPYAALGGAPYTVSFDNRALLINGTRTLLQSGSVHYPRLPVAEWGPLLKLARAHGLNMLQTYLFWDWHAPSADVIDFQSEGRDLNAFLNAAAEAGLFVNLRIGPYACAEWTYGGLPVWLRDIPDMVFRTNNTAWLREVRRFVSAVVEEVEPMLARNGGPIVLMQIENEYGNEESWYGAGGQEYVRELAQFVSTLSVDVPWIMCQQSDAPPQIISTCNGFYCDNWIGTHAAAFPDQPAMWTENWNGWFQHWGESVPHRPVEDDMFAVARFVSRGGAFHNYYMVFGGTSYGRTVGGPNIVTSYDYDVAINEYGLPNPAKFNQSRALHYWLDVYAAQIMGADAIPAEQMLSAVCSAIVYPDVSGAGTGVTFLSNIGRTAATVQWQGASYALPAWSVTIVDSASAHTVFNTATGPWTLPTEDPQQSLEPQLIHRPHHTKQQQQQHKQKPVAAAADSAFVCIPDRGLGLWRPASELYFSTQPLEQIATTQDTTDYLLYSTNVTLEAADIALGSTGLALSNVGDYAIIQLSQPASSGSGAALTSVVYMTAAVAWGAWWKAALPVPASEGWSAGPATLSILSQTLGLMNYGPFLETYQRGLVPGNSSILFGSSGAPVDLGSNGWAMQVGLEGEQGSGNYSTLPSTSPLWLPTSACAALIPAANLVWFRLQLSLSLDADPTGVFALDLMSMGKGAVWVNGHALGRYWLLTATAQSAGECDPSLCSYIGGYATNQCRTGCGEPSQRFYHVPRAWLTSDAQGGVNEVTIMEENPASRPERVTLVRMN